MYVVPKGEGWLIDGSFGDTKDMLSFYSKMTGVKYVWPKYAEDAMYDFGGGMENVSATTLQESALTEPREGFHRMASLNSHELGHQWFGDFVTCKDWGQIWLNESFATFMQMMYFEHSRGKTGYDEEVEANMRSYFNESRRYQRPIMTRMYSNPDVMFDSHTYPKGGVVLHTLRKLLGDDVFWAGIKLYLTTNAHTPVESWQLCKAMTDSSGINCEPFFTQWIYKPGHPVLDPTWTWDDSAKQVVVKVQQTQDTSNGTPIYDIDAKVGLIKSGSTITLSRRCIYTPQATRSRFRVTRSRTLCCLTQTTISCERSKTPTGQRKNCPRSSSTRRSVSTARQPCLSDSSPTVNRATRPSTWWPTSLRPTRISSRSFARFASYRR